MSIWIVLTIAAWTVLAGAFGLIALAAACALYDLRRRFGDRLDYEWADDAETCVRTHRQEGL